MKDMLPSGPFGLAKAEAVSLGSLELLDILLCV